jgi:hypothetical protein
MALQTPNPMNVTVGEKFIIKLKEANNHHSCKSSEIEDTSVCVQATTSPTLGEYTFSALRED